MRLQSPSGGGEFYIVFYMLVYNKKYNYCCKGLYGSYITSILTHFSATETPGGWVCCSVYSACGNLFSMYIMTSLMYDIAKHSTNE